MLYCFLFNGTCDLFQTVVDKTDAEKLSEWPILVEKICFSFFRFDLFSSTCHRYMYQAIR